MQQYMSMILNMLVEVELLKESPAEISLGNLREEAVVRVHGDQVSHHIS